MAAHNWRVLRERAMGKGIGDLMALASMHIVLDAAEQLGLEAATAGAKSEAQLRQALTGYYDKIYKPDVITKVINGKDYVEPPPGWSDEEVEASFDAFLAATH